MNLWSYHCCKHHIVELLRCIYICNAALWSMMSQKLNRVQFWFFFCRTLCGFAWAPCVYTPDIWWPGLVHASKGAAFVGLGSTQNPTSKTSTNSKAHSLSANHRQTITRHRRRMRGLTGWQVYWQSLYPQLCDFTNISEQWHSKHDSNSKLAQSVSRDTLQRCFIACPY